MEIPPGLIDSAAILRTRATTDSIHRDFRAGRLVRIRRGFYIPSADWVRALPSERFAWSAAAIARSVPGAVLCMETAALANGVPALRTPECVELATTMPGRSGTRRPSLLVLGGDQQANEIRNKRSYPLRYHLRESIEPTSQGEFRCTGLVQTALDIMFSAKLSQALVVADGVARKLRDQGVLPPGSRLRDLDSVAAAISAHPSAAARLRADLVASLASPLAESVGESYSRAAFEFLGFEQPVLQHDFRDGDGFIGRGDFWWPEQRVAGEFDGKGKYLDAELRGDIPVEQVLYREKLREDRIRGLGFGFVRWGWSDVDNPEKLRRKLLAAGLPPRNRA
ncbi:hypothetical protein V3C33_19625 [Micrococcaceae bacterium Sec5.7]